MQRHHKTPYVLRSHVDRFTWLCIIMPDTYRKISNIRGTKSQNLNDSCLVLQLSLTNPLKPGFEGTAHLKQHSY